MRSVVLISPAADARARESLSRALRRFPCDVETSGISGRGARLREIAGDPDVELITVVDADAVLAADAFGSLRRALAGNVVLLGGRAIVGASQRLGAMFGPSRSGPDPFALTALAGLANDRQVTDLMRGPVDVPQRGAFVVSAAFVRTLAHVPDDVLLHLDLAVYARAAGRGVVCEPSLSFLADEDSIELRAALLDLRRYANVGVWHASELHRDPERLRTAFVTREARVMGNVRGYERRPMPPIDVIAVAADEMSRARVQRNAGSLAAGGRVTMCGPGDGDVLRRELAKTGDRYVLVASGPALPTRATVEVLAERIERNGRIALALESATPPYGAALFHSARIVNGGGLRGAGVTDVIAAAIEQLPAVRLFAAAEAGEIVPAVLPPFAPPATLDAVFVAAAKPVVTQQTLEALLGEKVPGSTTVVYPAGAATVEKYFATHAQLKKMPDDSDVHLAVGLNRALAGVTADVVAIVRDDVQVPRGILARLSDAFRRMPRLAVAVPRVGGFDRPEALPDLGYRDMAEMQSIYDRRADAYAREAMLLDWATVPMMVVRRDVLELVGGFDERFGFSRIGIEDFTRRVRSANYLVAVCDDAYAHVFPFLEAASFVGGLDDAPFLRAAFQKRWSAPRGFDPERDRIALTAAPPAAAASAAAQSDRPTVRILVPLKNEAEWLAARPLLADLAQSFRAADPVEVAIGLDGEFGLQTALAQLRELLTETNVPMEQTLNVKIDFVSDVAVWRDEAVPHVRAAGAEREALGDVAAIDGSAAVRAFLAELPR